MSVIRVSTAAAVEVLPFHRDVLSIAQTGHRAAETMLKKMRALLVSRYGATAPTFEQYRADKAALRQLAKDKKLADDQWLRKPFAAAIKAEYGALPESQDAAAVAKRAQRDAKKAAAPAPAPVGAPAGQTQEHAPSEAEQIEQIVTRLGLIKTADAIVRILEADERTKAQATHLKKMLAKVAQQLATTA